MIQNARWVAAGFQLFSVVAGLTVANPGKAWGDLRNQGVPSLKTPGVVQKSKKNTIPTILRERESGIGFGKSTRAQTSFGSSALAFVDTMAQDLDTQYKNALSALVSPAPSCDSAQAPAYLLALQIRGDFPTCTAFAQACVATKATAKPSIFWLGAQCSKAAFDLKTAESLFLESVTEAEGAFEFAQFLFQTSRASEMKKALEQSALLKPDAALWEGIIRRQNETDLAGLTKADVDSFLVNQLASTQISDSLKEKLWAAQIDIAGNDYRYPDAIALLKSYSGKFKNPTLWYYLAYSLLYAGLDKDFDQARKIYDVYDLYSHSMTQFPVEQNTYTYSEIYGAACVATLTQGQDRKDLAAIRAGLREGTMTVVDAKNATEALNARLPGMADILATLGGLQFIEGNLKDAEANLWKAHRACRYFNRANWGLVQVRRQKNYESLPDFADNLKRMNRETLGKKAPQATANYILNWKSLPAEVQKRILFGARIWTDYFEQFQKAGLTSYIKYAFDVLSESPELQSIADARIGGPSYPNDNRLWDDVRGIGGDHVVADLGEVFQTAQGDYNLLGHEIAHQFHMYAENKDPILDRCFTDLYDAAKKASRFPDGYSAYNQYEYFAQGVTYWLVPGDVPSRFGLNRQWVKKNDPDQMSFIESIHWSGGDLSKVSCVTAQNPVVVFETTEGRIEMELFEKQAPISVQNFLRYVDSGLFDQTIFHRVIKDFVVQGGIVDTQLKEIQDFGTIINEAKNGIPNHRGALAMARATAKDSASNSFYFNVKENPHLNHKDDTDQGYGYAVFGKVTEGLDVIDTIAAVATDATDQPLQNRVILSAKRK
ncbi:MAG: peptidylprolyl isomerase [Bdellovibrionales bacterium]|nr:peptidylprolyl isomerase [Bdellovibrionales bacterium]